MSKTTVTENFTWMDLVKGYVYMLGAHKRKYLFLDLCLILLLTYSVVPPLLLGKIVDFFTSYKPGDNLQTFYWYIVILGCSFSLVSFLRLQLKNFLGNIRSEITYVLRTSGFEKLLDFSVEWHDQQMVGAKTQRINSGISAFTDLSHMMENIVFDALASFTGILIVFLFLEPAFLIFFAVYLLLYSINLFYFTGKIQARVKQQNLLSEKSSGAFTEGLNNLLTIKTLGASDHFTSHIARKEADIRTSNLEINRLVTATWQIFQILNGFSYTVFLLMIGHSIISGSITAGVLVIFYGYLERLIGSASRLQDVYDRLSRNKVAISRMLPIFLDREQPWTGKKSFPKNWKKLAISDGYFNYQGNLETENAPKALFNLNLEIARYEKIGIVGRSGSGKSTLSKLLVGLYNFKSGQYQIGGKDFYALSEQQIKREITLILQDSEMFNLSLLENITLLRELNDELLQLALEIAQLGPVIKKLPQGLDTLIGEKGYHLSGGERQRVGIARAIYKNSQILIFDESTSSLDSKTEALVLRGLEEKLEKKTIIFIAHKVATLQGVDRVVVMENGRIVEEGAYDQLAADQQSEFYKIYSSQLKK
jgi:ABC-type multidrug transport system fused ATPase/permease subunit